MTGSATASPGLEYSGTISGCLHSARIVLNDALLLALGALGAVCLSSWYDIVGGPIMWVDLPMQSAAWFDVSEELAARRGDAENITRGERHSAAFDLRATSMLFATRVMLF